MSTRSLILRLKLCGFFDFLATGFSESGRSAIARNRFDGARAKLHFDEAIFFGHPDALGLQVGHLAALGVALRVRY